MANATCYHLGKPYTPAVIKGITFTLYDEVHRIWAGTGLDTAVAALVADGMPFMSQAQLDRFRADLDAVTAALDSFAALEETAATSSGLVGAGVVAYNTAVADREGTLTALAAALATHNADVAALADAPEDADLIAAEAASAAALETAVANDASRAENLADAEDALAALRGTAASDAKAVLEARVFALAAPLAIPRSRDGKVNPFLG